MFNAGIVFHLFAKTDYRKRGQEYHEKLIHNDSPLNTSTSTNPSITSKTSHRVLPPKLTLQYVRNNNNQQETLLIENLQIQIFSHICATAILNISISFNISGLKQKSNEGLKFKKKINWSYNHTRAKLILVILSFHVK